MTKAFKWTKTGYEPLYFSQDYANSDELRKELQPLPCPGSIRDGTHGLFVLRSIGVELLEKDKQWTSSVRFPCQCAESLPFAAFNLNFHMQGWSSRSNPFVEQHQHLSCGQNGR